MTNNQKYGVLLGVGITAITVVIAVAKVVIHIVPLILNAEDK